MAFEKRQDDVDVDSMLDAARKPPHIRCPLCGWRPGKGDRWQCHCAHVWNTFDTYGACPNCKKQWTETMCPACNRWSKHKDWYDKEE